MSRQKQYASYKSLAPKDDKPKYTCLEIEHLQHRKKLLLDHRIVCIDLHAKWCEPCKIVSPKFADLSHQYNNPGHCMLVKEDVDLELTRDYQIAGIPAFIFYVNGELLRSNDGKPIDVVGGDIDKVKEILNKLMGR